MFSFKKKDEKKKEEKKKEKKEKKKDTKRSKEKLSQEELTRLEDIQKGLRKSSGRSKGATPGYLGVKSQAYAVADDHSNGQYHANVEIGANERSVDPPLTSPSGSEGSAASTPGFEKGGQFGLKDPIQVLPTSAPLGHITEESKHVRQMPEKKRKSSKGILKLKSSSSSSSSQPNSELVVKVNDSVVLAQNTAYNERISDAVDGGLAYQIPHPISESEPPGEKTFNVDLRLPAVAPPKPPRARDVILSRQTNGGFGFTLRRTNIEERSGPNGAITRRQVHFAEPSSTQRDNATGLLPGDRLVEVNGINIENSPRDAIIEKIRGSGDSVTLKVQPIPELIELSMRSGMDGSEVHLEEQLMKTGTLARTASMRHKDKKAKTDDQLAQEKSWLAAERVWLVHRAGFSSAKRMARMTNGVNSGGGEVAEVKVKVRLEHNEEVIDVEEEDVEKANPPQFDRAEDLASLQFLNESSVLHTLRQRYGANLIHTYAGRNLLVINPTHQLSVYSDKVIQMFRGCKQEDMPPHIYAAAQTAYRSMQSTRMDQSIVFTGRSGGGKSWNVRHVLQYLTIVAGTNHNVVTVDKITAVTTLLDAFGGARTIQNTSATRCANIYSLDFDHLGQIASSTIQILMLEKYRIVRRPEGERAFNIFYYLLAGAEQALSQELSLNRMYKENPYIQVLQKSEEVDHAKAMWQKVQTACQLLGFTSDECRALWCTLAAIIHLGAAGAVRGSGSKAQFERPSEAQRAASLLGTSLEDLARNTFSPKALGTPTRAPLRAVPSDGSDAGAGGAGGAGEALEGMISGLYTELVNAVVSLVNRGLSSSYRTKSSILVVDIPGLQVPEACGRGAGASFQDLCNNYAQERLQLLFHDTTFTQQRDKYAQENIPCELDESDSESSPGLMVNLIDKQQGLEKSGNRNNPIEDAIRTSNPDLRNTDQKGILWLLDEESIFPGASDDSFLERLYLHYHDEANRADGAIKQSAQQKSFILNHLHGTVPVSYNASNWLREARENPSIRSAAVVLQESQKPTMSRLFISLSGSLPSSMVGSVAGIEGSSSLRRASSIRRAWTSGTAAIKRKSLCLQVKYQVDGIIDSIRRTKLHFVHCVLPHPDAGLCEARMIAGQPPNAPTSDLVDVPLLRSQVRGSKIMAAIRIHRFGFPESMLFQEFRYRFELLAPAEAKMPEPVMDERKAVDLLLNHLDVDQSALRMGLSQIFFRPGALVQLEDKRDQQLSETILRFQAHCRGYLARQKLKHLKIQLLAITCIQRNVRKFLAVKNWPWWKLVTKVLPLLDVHRTEEELKMKDIELEQLRAKVAKLETERNNLKQNVDKFDHRVTELSADLSEEHAAATHASEMLESETAERLRLEKEVKDLRSNFSALQRKSEKMEMEVMEHRMVRSSIIEPDTSSDEDSDSMYRLKYMQLRNEMDLGRKRLQQEHEEQMETVLASRKSVERKFMEALEEGEEHKRQVGNLKKRSQKLVEESRDMKLHLETQQTRNADLEKKQRKFDAELSKIQQDLQHEKTAKERLQRENDKLQGETFMITQQLEDVRSEVKLKEDRIEILNSEMDDLASHDTLEVKEVTALKRARRELESKLQDQEEELDDQAGQIQQLEQTKLRLEMQLERIKQSHQKELDAKDEEVEEVRASAQNKVKQMELQLEEDYEERQSVLREKRDLERRVQELMDKPLQGDKDAEKRLRRDLKKTKALFKDAQTMLDRQNAAAPSGAKLKQLKNELEDAHFATSSAVKAKQNVEAELAELQGQMDDIMKAKTDAEERASHANREKAELESKLEDQEEDFNDLLKKHRAHIHQMSAEQAKITGHLETISEMANERHDLQEKVSELQAKLDFITESTVDRATVNRLEAKVRDLESKLDLEQTTKNKLENQVERLRDSLDRSTSDQSSVHQKELRGQETTRKLQREARDLREELEEAHRKESEAGLRRHEMELEVESFQSSNDQLQSDLKLAFKRIADLQRALEDDIGSDSDLSVSVDSDDSDNSDTDSEGEYVPRYSHYSSNRSSRLSSTSSVDSTKFTTRGRVYSSTSERSEDVRRRSRPPLRNGARRRRRYLLAAGLSPAGLVGTSSTRGAPTKTKT